MFLKIVCFQTLKTINLKKYIFALINNDNVKDIM